MAFNHYQSHDTEIRELDRRAVGPLGPTGRPGKESAGDQESGLSHSSSSTPQPPSSCQSGCGVLRVVHGDQGPSERLAGAAS